jgi:hypothetical protein
MRRFSGAAKSRAVIVLRPAKSTMKIAKRSSLPSPVVSRGGMATRRPRPAGASLFSIGPRNRRSPVGFKLISLSEGRTCTLLLPRCALASASQRLRPSLGMKIKNPATPLGVQGARCCLTTRANSSRKVGPARPPQDPAAHPLQARKAVRRPTCSPRLAGRHRPSLIQIPPLPNGEVSTPEISSFCLTLWRTRGGYLCRERGCSRKNRSISAVASGPRGSVKDPSGLPPNQACPAP